MLKTQRWVWIWLWMLVSDCYCLLDVCVGVAMEAAVSVLVPRKHPSMVVVRCLAKWYVCGKTWTTS